MTWAVSENYFTKRTSHSSETFTNRRELQNVLHSMCKIWQLYYQHKCQNCSTSTTQTDKEFCVTQHCSTESTTSIPQGFEAATQNFHCEV